MTVDSRASYAQPVITSLRHTRFWRKSSIGAGFLEFRYSPHSDDTLHGAFIAAVFAGLAIAIYAHWDDWKADRR